jgi:hypothetical protein
MELNNNTRDNNNTEPVVTVFTPLEREPSNKSVKTYKHLDKILPTDFIKRYFSQVKTGK